MPPQRLEPERLIRILSDGASALAWEPELDPALGRLLEGAVDAVDAPIGAIYLQDPDRADLQLAVTIGLDDADRTTVESTADAATDPVVATARDRTILHVGPDSDPGLRGGMVAAAGLTSANLRPLAVTRGGIELPVGVLLIGWHEPRTLTEDEDRVVGAIADLASAAIDRTHLVSMVLERSEWFERMAHTDPLTGLANYRTFSRILELELARVGRQGGELSLAIFDVDDFAAANAAAGHDAGDDILRAVASVLSESVRLVDTIARYGGDEFVLIAPGAAGVTVAQRVLSGVAALPAVEGRPVRISAGVARFPSDASTADDLTTAAESALAAAQAHGGGQVAIAGVATPT